MTSQIILTKEERELVLTIREVKKESPDIKWSVVPISLAKTSAFDKSGDTDVYSMNAHPFHVSGLEMEYLEGLKDLLIHTGGNIVFYELEILKILRKYIKSSTGKV